MREEELRRQMAVWADSLHAAPPPVAVIRRRARRWIATMVSAGAVAATGAAVVVALVIRPAAGVSSPPPVSRPSPSATAPSNGPGQRQCAAGELRASAPRSAMSSTMPGVVAVIYLQNVGRASCALEGWPTLAVLSAHGGPAAVRVEYGTGNGSWTVPVTRVAIPPGSRAGVSLLIAAPASASGCLRPWSWAITPPGGSERLVIPERPASGGPCPGDVVEVSPVRPGSLPLTGVYSAPPAPGAPTGGLFTTPPAP